MTCLCSNLARWMHKIFLFLTVGPVLHVLKRTWDCTFGTKYIYYTLINKSYHNLHLLHPLSFLPLLRMSEFTSEIDLNLSVRCLYTLKNTDAARLSSRTICLYFTWPLLVTLLRLEMGPKAYWPRAYFKLSCYCNKIARHI